LRCAQAGPDTHVKLKKKKYTGFVCGDHVVVDVNFILI
jgi:hypothetical protein